MPTRTPAHVLIAAVRLAPELPGLLGPEAWAGVAPQLEAGVAALASAKDSGDQQRLALGIAQLLAPHEAAAQRLAGELAVVAAMEAELAARIERLSELRASTPAALHDAVGTVLLALAAGGERVIDIDVAGVGGAVSKKSRNFKRDLATLAPIAGSAAGIFAPHPLLVAVGVIATLIAADQAMIARIPEREASVFWGCILSRSGGWEVDEVDVLRHTNEARRGVGLPELGPGEVRIALGQLAQLRCVEMVADSRWRMIETYQVKFGA